MDETTSGRMIEWAADRDVAENSFSVSRFFFSTLPFTRLQAGARVMDRGAERSRDS